MNMQSRAAFVTTIGGLLAAAGSAIGLGNLWRFPTQVGQSGGSAFLLVYLGVILLFGLPLLICEFVIGRRSRVNVAKSYEVLAPKSHWKAVGYASSIIAYAIFCYYAVIVGWVLFYLWESICGHLSSLGTAAVEGSNPYKDLFVNFISNPVEPLVYLFLTIGVIFVIIVSGVEKGIERTSKFLVPSLFLIMIVLAICAAFMPGAAEGYKFLFDFDVSKINADVCLSAIGQCFYSFSIGMGLVTYASYFTRETNLVKTAISVGFLDTFVAVLAGLIIFPAVFSVSGFSPEEGAGLVFISLPAVFQSAFSSYPLLAWLVPVAFYFILFVAAVTSAMFLFEVATAFCCELVGMSRMKAATIIAVSSLVIGSVASLSMGSWDFISLFGMNLIDFLDYVSSKIVLPLTGLGAALFVGWKMKKADVLDELNSTGPINALALNVFFAVVRYVVPLLIIAIMINNFL